MAKRTTKAEGALLGALFVIGLPIFAAMKLYEAIGWMIPVGVVAAILLFVLWHKAETKRKRLAYLRAKYGDENVVQKIYQGYFWQGQSAEQLRDSLGEPDGVDNKLLKTKSRDVWKYHRQGVNRFALRITVENGCVVGWDKKD